MKGYVHSLQSMGTLDGPGLRAVVFLSGCPLRCIYCHNPDTHALTDGEYCDAEDITGRVKRLYPYIKDGGVTFSGGEPCLQAAFVKEMAESLREMGLHIALDTSGCIMNGDVDSLLDSVDLVLLDIKFTNDSDYFRYTGTHIDTPLAMLRECERRGLAVWIRHVVVPGINDNKKSISALRELLRPYSVIEKIELLPFRKLCLEKYEELGIDFPLKDTPEMNPERLSMLEECLK